MNWHALLEEAVETTGKYQKEAPDVFTGFGLMGKAAKKNGALSEKTKEFIALGIAISTRCDICIATMLNLLCDSKQREKSFVSIGNDKLHEADPLSPTVPKL